MAVNPPLASEEFVIASALAMLERERIPASQVATYLESRFANVGAGEGAGWVARAQAAQAAGRAAQSLLPGESVGAAQPNPLGGSTVLVTARAQYGTGPNAGYRIIRLRVKPGTTLQEIGDLIDARAYEIESPKFDLDPDSYVGSVITHVW